MLNSAGSSGGKPGTPHGAAQKAKNQDLLSGTISINSLPGLSRQSVKASCETAAQSRQLRRAFLQALSLKKEYSEGYTMEQRKRKEQSKKSSTGSTKIYEIIEQIRAAIIAA